MSSRFKRIVYLETDDHEEAYNKFKECQKEDPRSHWAVADIRNMTDPPKTVYRWIVFKLIVD